MASPKPTFAEVALATKVVRKVMNRQEGEDKNTKAVPRTPGASAADLPSGENGSGTREEFKKGYEGKSEIAGK
jgi:hypothetical protein